MCSAKQFWSVAILHKYTFFTQVRTTRTGSIHFVLAYKTLPLELPFHFHFVGVWWALLHPEQGVHLVQLALAW